MCWPRSIVREKARECDEKRKKVRERKKDKERRRETETASGRERGGEIS